MNNRNSLSGRLTRIILLVTAVVFTASFLVATLSSYNLISQEAVKSTERLLDASISDIEKTLLDVEVTVRSASWTVKDHLDDKDYLYYVTKKNVSENPVIIGSAIGFEPSYFPEDYYFSPYTCKNTQTGELRSMQLGSPAYDYFCIDWYQIPYLMGKPCWSEPTYDDAGGEMWMTTYSLPLKDDNGHVFAIMTADVSLSSFSKILKDVRPYPNSSVFLTTRCQSIINIHSGAKPSGETIFSTSYYLHSDDKNLDVVAKNVAKGEKGITRYSRGWKNSFIVYGPLSNGWMLSMSCSFKDVLANASTMSRIMLLIGLLGLIVLSLLCYFMIRRLIRPLSQFSDAAKSISKGQFDTLLPEVTSNDEIRDLHDSFANMQSSIKDYMENLKSTTAVKERLSSELNIARSIQESMLPKDFPHDDKVDLFAILKPAKEVGGDLYDFFVKDNVLYFTVGDVSGKGVPASMFMAITKAAFRFIAKMDLPIEEVMSKMNDSISDGNSSGMFVTMFMGALDLGTGVLNYCNAGHNPPIVVTADGKQSFLKTIPNLAVGLFPNFTYQPQQYVFEKGSYMITYTDGVSEAERADYAQYGDDRLLAWAGTIRNGEDSEAVCHSLVDNVTSFTEGNAQNDDVTIMIINYK